MSTLAVGVLALQGDFALHFKSLQELGCDVREVRTPEQLGPVRGLVIPGGESTTVGKLLVSSGLGQEIARRTADKSLALFGTCMGLIVMAQRIENRHKNQYTMELLDVTVNRNAYGRQVDSFEVDLPVQGLGKNGGGPYHAVFIRAPHIVDTGPDVQVLSQHADRPVLVRDHNILGACFHPEITTDNRVHRLFLEMVDRETQA